MKKNKTLQQLREQAMKDIVAIMKKHNTDNLMIVTGDTPVLKDDPYDNNLTYTLDGIGIHDEEIVLFGSNCCHSAEWLPDNLGTDDLVFIAEWLEDNEEEIWDGDED